MSNSDRVMKKGISGLHFSEYHLILLLVAFSLALRLYFAWKPLEWQIDKGNADDAYYYFQIARNIAHGKGATFDGLTPTNGFHPLYMVILIPLYLLFPNSPDLTVKIAISLLMLFSVLAALPLYQMIKITISRTAGLVALIAWLFNPWVLVITFAGVESAVYIFFVSLVAYIYIKYQGRGISINSRALSLLLGLTLGLVILARSDGVFFLLAILIDMLIVRENVFNSRLNNFLPKEKFIHLAMIFGMCIFVLLPWLIWNLGAFGSILQVSGAAVLRNSHFGLATDMFSISNSIFKSSLLSLIDIAILSFQVVILFVVLSIFRKVPRYNRFNEPPSEYPSLLRRPLRFIFIYSILWFVFYSWIFWGRQSWYYLPALFIASIIAGILYFYFHHLVVRSAIGPYSLKIIVCFWIVTFIIGIWVWQNQVVRYPLQSNGFRLAEWLSREIEADARVGAWNSGILGYFSNRTVINLDGVVNNGLYEYSVERGISVYDVNDIHDYFIEMQIDYITDYEDIFSDYYQKSDYSKFLELIYEFPSVDGEYDVRVFRVVN